MCRSTLVAPVVVLGLGALFLLFALFSYQRVSCHSFQTLQELLADLLSQPNRVRTKMDFLLLLQTETGNPSVFAGWLAYTSAN